MVRNEHEGVGAGMSGGGVVGGGGVGGEVGGVCEGEWRSGRGGD